MRKLSRIRRVKVAAMAGLMLASSTLFGACGLSDIKVSAGNGALDFVNAYAESILRGLAPTPPDVFPGDWP